MSDKNIEKSISNPEIIESVFSALVSSLKQNKVPFFIESEGLSKIIRIDLSELKLFYPQTSDLIMFKYSGQAFFRFFFDEETLKQEERYIKDFFGESSEPNQADFDKYIFVRSFAALDVNILKAKEFEKYIEQWSADNNGRKIVFTHFFNICNYVNIEELIRDIPAQDSSLLQETIYYKFFIKEFLCLQDFINYAVKNEFLISEGSALRYFDEYGLETFFKEVSGTRFPCFIDIQNKRLFIRMKYTVDGASCFTKFFVTTEEISLALCPNYTIQTINDMNVPISASFKLEKNVTEKIRQFMSDYFQKSITVNAVELPKFLESLESTDKKIIIHVTDKITFDIREKIESAFLCNDFENLNITMDLSQAIWDCACVMNVWLMKSVILSEEITDIDGSNILCPFLEEIIVSEKNPNFVSVDGVLYNKEKTVIIRYPQAKQGSFVIPDTVKEIRPYAFCDCHYLSEIKIPANVRVIGEASFKKCVSLKNVSFSDGVTELCQSTFEKCDSLEQIKLPDTITAMGTRVFAECKNLKSVILPKKITEIPAVTFVNCQSLESIRIPDSVQSIQKNTFRNCTSLLSVEIPASLEIDETLFGRYTKIIRRPKPELQIQGRYNTAKVFTDEVDSDADAQILQMMNQPWSCDMTVRIMPDVHAGKGCTVGSTMTISDKVSPSLVGIDIGCGVEVLVVKKAFVQYPLQDLLEKLDDVVHNKIPSGRSGRSSEHKFTKDFDWNAFIASVDVRTAKLQLGSLGGGNHFIEADCDDEGNFFFVIHSGSRNLGKEICDYYQNLVNQSKLSYIEGSDLEHYLHDMNLAQNYAALNRCAMLDEIKVGLGIKKQDIIEEFSTIHNYIDIKNKILRKGAISAQKGERVIIPMNMRDGSLICIGKGNADWNYSAPHGAGRLYKRGDAKELFSLEEYQQQMQGIFSSSIALSTIDESPMAYKPMESILEKIEPTVEVVKRIKPIYNFKAGGQ